tara:strand:- start:1424 stop:1591 length:168 start_codon:yes stop_codon:yes gene_type:complete
MSEEESVDSMKLSGFVAYTAFEGLKYAVPIIICLSISAKFIERLTLVIFKIGGGE